MKQYLLNAFHALILTGCRCSGIICWNLIGIEGGVMTEESLQLNFTDACAQKVWDLIEEEEDNQGLNLRVYIQGGGCSGFQYGFMFDTEVRDDDCVVEKEIVNVKGEGLGTVHLLVDSLSYPYLKGADIDYREDVAGSQFVIRNPNAKTTCGCGSSFSVEDSNESD
jgi:iron-sulfur cluster insertion protein